MSRVSSFLMCCVAIAVSIAMILEALSALAAFVRKRLTGLTVVGITGSQGKTSTKDLLAHMLSVAGPTVAPAGSFNNDLGLPITLLQCDERTKFK